jgi:4-amino-4-deoxy-L-arabinose transferase-like glycosyltransferase
MPLTSWIQRAGSFVRRRHRAVLYGVVAVHALLLAYSAAIHSPTIDEPAHVAAGLSHWHFSTFSLYRVNPPLVRLVAAAPLLATDIATDWRHYADDLDRRVEHVVGDDLADANGSRIFRYVTIARWACIGFSIVGALVCCWWARLLLGRLAGVAAATLWCFSPMILGHGSLVTPDVAGTALGLAACYSFARWLAAPSLPTALVAGFALGLAEVSKSTWIVLFPALVFVWVVVRLFPAQGSPRPALWHLAIILAAGWLSLAAIYGFQGLGAPLRTIPLRSQSAQSLLCTSADGELVVRPELRWLPIPLPRDYLAGLDQQWSDLEGPNRSFLAGQWREEGWWYYYAYGLAVKEPLGTLALAALSAVFWAAMIARNRWLRQVSRKRLRNMEAAWLLLLCPALVFLLASSQTGMNHHVRYVMPVLPYLYIFGAGLLAPVGPWGQVRKASAGILIGFVILSSLRIFPHSLSYFNELAGGPAGGIRHLDNSNVDWGQDLLLLRDWKQRHVPDEPIYLAYFGRVNPVHAGIDFKLPPLRPRDGEAPRLEPGWYAVSATLLLGRAYHVRSPEGRLVPTGANALAYFQERAPAGRVGYSIYLFRVEAGTSPTQ